MPAQSILLWLTLGLWSLALWRTVWARSAIQHTSLTSAWVWGMATELGWLGLNVLMLRGPQAHSILDQLGLWTAILTLCPFIAVLGARRPTTRVWTWFIVIPLMAVLGWPSLTVLRTWPTLPPLRVQAPVFLGFGLVAVMGLGNYLGTKWTWSALLAGLAVGLSLVPLSAGMRWNDAAAGWIRAASVLTAALAACLVCRPVHREKLADSRFDRLWLDFRNTFGIVWAIRIQEQVNALAAKEKWLCRIGPFGVEWNAEITPEQRREAEGKLEHALRWALRRFVDPEWIDERLVRVTDVDPARVPVGRR